MAKSSEKSHSCDVLIIGGSLNGGTLACALSHLGMQTTIIDTLEPSTGLDAEFDGRASAIAFASKCLLETIGLWDLMAETACPIQDIRVSEGNSPFFNNAYICCLLKPTRSETLFHNRRRSGFFWLIILFIASLHSALKERRD